MSFKVRGKNNPIFICIDERKCFKFNGLLEKLLKLTKKKGIKEADIKKAVIKLFEKDSEYFVIKEPFNVGVMPDVVAFKWIDNYQIEAIAVECKGSKGETVPAKFIIDFATEQARKYQEHFPYVYLATPRVSKSEEEIIVRNTLTRLRIGWICVSKEKESEYEANLQSEALVSPRLIEADYTIKVRQRLVAIWAYNEVFAERDFKFNRNLMEPEVVHCFKKEESPNFLLTNYLGDYYCGICLEQPKNIKKILPNIQPAEFHRRLQELSEDFIVEFTYIDTYKPREVSWPLMRKKVNQLSEKDIEWIKKVAEEKEWKTRIMLLRKVWGRSEIVSRDEHKKALEKVKEEITPVKKYLEDLKNSPHS